MLRVASWNMDHWRGSRSTPEHRDRVWSYLAGLDVDIALAQEAVPPVAGWDRVVPDPPWRIDGHRPWASGIATRQLEARQVQSTYTSWSAKHEFEISPDSNHKGALAVADVEVPKIGTVTAISVYALMKPVYAQTTLFRIVADLIPLFDSPAKTRRHFVLGGDFNAHTQKPNPKELPRYRAIFTAFESLGLVDCFKETIGTRPRLKGCPCEEPECFHVQTRRFPRHKGTPKEFYSAHLDYLYASPKLAESLKACYAVGANDESVWSLSDHCPVVAEFEL